MTPPPASPGASGAPEGGQPEPDVGTPATDGPTRGDQPEPRGSAPATDGPERAGKLRRRFVGDLPFTLDQFQQEALDAVDRGHSVLVSAPTGSGKTLVAAYAVDQALHQRGKAFYTTPLKALSNQKYLELAARHGTDRVGLLTGDTAVRPDAPIVVMTTEVLRNMLLAGSDLLAGLQTVILDEVHYLQDPYRGAVWEEVLVLCPAEVVFVCLSATVNNALELGGWLRSVRGPTEVVVERHRPITLRHHVAVHRREDAETLLFPLLAEGRTDSEGLRVDQAVRRATQTTRYPRWRGPGGPGAPRLPYRSPRRTELVDLLDEAQLLPAIVFIFSRAACEDAVRQCLRDGLRLTDGGERSEVRRIAEARVEGLSDDDLRILGFDEWLEGLEAGIAAHHAGMVPAFRETVEACFAAGHLRVVFATETLSLGINMPARTVVIERFTKFGGSGRAPLTSGEYAQMTGRAGRRGLDAEGHAVVAWSAETAIAEMARVAVAPPPDLRSAFRPTYNLVVNLVRRFDRTAAVELLQRSFAQWQAEGRGSGSGSASGGHETGGAGSGGHETGGAGSGGPGSGGRRATEREGHNLADLLARRLAVLEERGYVDGWRLTTPGLRLARIYHGSDLVVAEAVGTDVLEDVEPSVLAGVMSAFVFERRRARHTVDARRRRGDGGGSGRGSGAPRPGGRRPKAGGDRLGDGRRKDLAERLTLLERRAEEVRGLEEVHRVPRSRQPERGLATAVTSWARGAPFGVVLEVAAVDAGEIAPGDFVRTVKEVADLVGQVAMVSPDPAVAAAAQLAVPLLIRGVVAAGGLQHPPPFP